jgi:hypothetical protein
VPLSRSEELRLNAYAIRIAIWDLGIWIGLLFAVANLVGAEYRLVAVPRRRRHVYFDGEI